MSGAQADTTLEPATVLRLIQDLLPDVASTGLDRGSSTAEASGNGGHNDEASREEAGEILWDLSSVEANAQLMMDNYILDVLTCIIQTDESDRLAELSVGIAGNFTCPLGTAARLIQAAKFRDAVFEHAAWRDDSACLSEVCRLLSGVLRQQNDEHWLGRMLSDELLDRLGWILSNTLNSTLLERACTLIADIASAGERAVRAVLGRKLPDQAIACVEQHLQYCCASKAEPGGASGWGDADESDSSDPCFPSLAAVGAVLDILEALSEEDAGVHALQSHEEIPSLLAALLQHSTALLVRGRAAVLLAVLDAPATRQHFSQDAEALRSLLRLLLECTAGEGAEFVEGCWALTGFTARHLSASTVALPSEVLQVVVAEAAALAQAATDGALEGAARRRAGQALLGLAAAAESALAQPGTGPAQAGDGSSVRANEEAELCSGACQPHEALEKLQAAADALLRCLACTDDGGGSTSSSLRLEPQRELPAVGHST